MFQTTNKIRNIRRITENNLFWVMLKRLTRHPELCEILQNPHDSQWAKKIRGPLNAMTADFQLSTNLCASLHNIAHQLHQIHQSFITVLKEITPDSTPVRLVKSTLAYLIMVKSHWSSQPIFCTFSLMHSVTLQQLELM